MTGARTVAFVDATAGVAGDMLLGALVDAGLPLAALEEVVAGLRLDGVRVRARRVQKGPLAATKVDVLLPGAPVPAPEAHAHAAHGREHGHAHGHGPGHGPDASPAGRSGRAHPAVHGPPGSEPAHGPAHVHRTLPDVLAILRAAKGLPPEGLADATRAFRLLAEAEGRVHGIAPEEVHFHEVGALDALVDVVGVCVGLRRLGVVEVRASPLPWGTGTIQAAHGALPNPPPAVVHLLAGHPTIPSAETFEQVTPTGAALVRALSRGSSTPPGFVPRAVGVGAGDHPGGRLPNVVRVVLGEVASEGGAADALLLETNLDDATGQQVANAIDRALEAGALDAWAVPATMKKGRPGVVLSVLAAPADAAALEAVLFRETPTLGVRRRAVSRSTLPRRVVVVATPYGSIPVKVRAGPDGEEGTPEHDDCRAAAARAGVALRVVQAAAMAAWNGSGRTA